MALAAVKSVWRNTSSKFSTDLMPASRHTQLARFWGDSIFCFQCTLLFFSQVPSQLITASCTAKDNVCCKCCFCLTGRDWLGKSQHIAGYLHIHLEVAAPEVMPWSIRLGRGQGSSSVLQPPMVTNTEAKQGRPVLKQQQWGEGKHQNSSLSSLAFSQPCTTSTEENRSQTNPSSIIPLLESLSAVQLAPQRQKSHMVSCMKFIHLLSLHLSCYIILGTGTIYPHMWRLCRDAKSLTFKLTPQLPRALSKSGTDSSREGKEAGMSLHVLIKDSSFLLIHPSPFNSLPPLNSSHYH